MVVAAIWGKSVPAAWISLGNQLNVTSFFY